MSLLRLCIGLLLLLLTASLVTSAGVDATASHRHRRHSSLSSLPFPYEAVRGAPYNVSHDDRAVLVNGQRLLLQSGIIHYPRSTPDMWPRLMQLTRAANLNTVQTYGQRQKSRTPRCSACLS
jgi:hypothetical protein